MSSGLRVIFHEDLCVVLEQAVLKRRVDRALEILWGEVCLVLQGDGKPQHVMQWCEQLFNLLLAFVSLTSLKPGASLALLKSLLGTSLLQNLRSGFMCLSVPSVLSS